MRGKLETGQLENQPASWKLGKLEIFWPDTRAGKLEVKKLESWNFFKKNIPF